MNEYIIIRYINSFNFMLFLFMLNSILISYFLSLLLFYPEVLMKLCKLYSAILFLTLILNSSSICILCQNK